MTIVVQSSEHNIIAMPFRIMRLLNLQEGDQVKTIVEGETLRLAPIKHFLALRGVLRDDDDFDSALALLNQAWKEWTQPPSA